MSIFDYEGNGKGGPPLHVHHYQDEVFFITEGEYVFQAGEERFRLTAGDTIFLPRKVPHTWAQLSDKGKMLFFFQPAGKIDISIYQGVSFRPYTDAVYLRGAKFMENLRTRMGDEAFLAFIKDYAAQMSYKRASADDFFRILYTHTTADITDIVATYFQNPH